MIRLISVLLLIHFSFFGLISCTTEGTSEDAQAIADAAGDAGPIEEGDVADAPVAKDAAPTLGGEDDLEAELAKDDVPAVDKEQSAVAQSDQIPPAADDNLEKELSDKDLDAAAVASSEPPPTPPVEDTPPVPVPSNDLDPVPAPPPVAAAPVSEKARVRDIRYLANSNGGTVVIDTTQPVIYKTRMNTSTQQFVIEIADVELPAALQRPYMMKDFNSRFGSINAYQGSGATTARVVIQMSGTAAGEPIVQQEGTSLLVVPPAAPQNLAQATPQPSAPAEEAKSDAREGALAAKTLDEFLTGNQRFFGRSISLQVKDADIRDVVNFLAEESGANIVMSDDVSGKISLKLRRIPWDQALVTVMRSKALGYVRQGNVLRISTLKSLQNESEVSNKIIESQKSIVPAVVQVLPISYANIEELIKAITPFLSKEGKVVADKRTSTLIVTDKSEVVERVGKLVKTLDIAPAQVSIESKIVEAVEGFENFVGVNWGASGSPVHLSSSGGANGAPIDLAAGLSSVNLGSELTGTTPFSARLNIGTLDIFGDLTATLSLAEHDSLAKVISAPRISTINREKSTILQSSENVSVISTRSETTGAITRQEKRTPYSLELSVTPQITADGGVIMELDVRREFPRPGGRHGHGSARGKFAQGDDQSFGAQWADGRHRRYLHERRARIECRNSRPHAHSDFGMAV